MRAAVARRGTTDADGLVDVAPGITAACALDGVTAAFDRLRSPEVHRTIIRTPGRPGTAPEETT